MDEKKVMLLALLGLLKDKTSYHKNAEKAKHLTVNIDSVKVEEVEYKGSGCMPLFKFVLALLSPLVLAGFGGIHFILGIIGFLVGCYLISVAWRVLKESNTKVRKRFNSHYIKFLSRFLPDDERILVITPVNTTYSNGYVLFTTHRLFLIILKASLFKGEKKYIDEDDTLGIIETILLFDWLDEQNVQLKKGLPHPSLKLTTPIDVESVHDALVGFYLELNKSWKLMNTPKTDLNLIKQILELRATV